MLGVFSSTNTPANLPLGLALHYSINQLRNHDRFNCLELDAFVLFNVSDKI